MSTMEEEVAKDRRAPDHIRNRLAAWQKIYVTAYILHYIPGGIGFVSASIAVAAGDTKILMVISAACIAIVSFAQPIRVGNRFASAWRMLDSAVLRYELGITEIEDLLDVFEQAENRLGDGLVQDSEATGKQKVDRKAL